MNPHTTIAIDVQSLYSATPSGVGHYVLEVLRALPSTPDVEFVLFSRGWQSLTLPGSITDRPDMTHVHTRAPSKLINPLIALGFVSLERLLDRQVDTVWYPNTGYLPRTKARTVLTVHDLAWFIMPSTYNLVHHLRYRITRARTWIRNADHLIAVSSATKRDVQQLFGRTDADVTAIHHGVDHRTFTPTAGTNDATRLQQLGVTRPYVLSIATREPRKNLTSLVEAFDALRSLGHAIDLVIAGGAGWRRKQLQAAIRRSPYQQHIHVLGFVHDDDRPVLLRGAVTLVLPSRYEGFGMQILEAMACGTPVVASSNSSLPEIGGTAALTVHALAVQQLSQVLDALLTDSTVQQSCAERGIAQAGTFSWQKTAQKTVDLLMRGVQH